MKKILKTLRLSPLGDAAVYAEFTDTLDLEVNHVLQALAAAVRARALPWVRDVVPAICGIAVHFDPDHAALPAPLLGRMEGLLAECFKDAGRFEKAARTVDLPVCYDPVFGLDLEEISSVTKVPVADVIRRHTLSDHRVLMVGFSPGQPYIGGLDPRLAVPRRATPRTHVPAGSVAIANRQTAIYPYETPGGWNVIGRTPLALFDPAREPASLIAPGDRVRFVPITLAEFQKRQ